MDLKSGVVVSEKPVICMRLGSVAGPSCTALGVLSDARDALLHKRAGCGGGADERPHVARRERRVLHRNRAEEAKGIEELPACPSALRRW